ncbi:hypothetical protein [Aminivibrio sp.]|jgi:glutamyl-tRNA reductase|uniref:hypothetical protein n=1 Tax=Aminivibrio sp. TaxID=1872489 RepID=UPI001A3945CC|nr:hypothetical protein [Aminivibrio sp.]MBL3540468.1 hypothetical protein [Aminivibrio sp.]
MKNLFCISLDYTAASTAERDRAKNAWVSLPALREKGRILEAVPVSTCNRTEIYLRLPPGATVPEELLHPRARTLSGEEAVLHLLRVLLGLESMACGESSIVGQVRESYGEAGDLCGPWLHRLFQGCLRMAKLLRTCYHPGREPSVPRLMAGKLRDHPSFPSVPSLVVGAGKMGEETARILAGLAVPLSVTNRSPGRGRSLAETLGVPFLPWEEWRGRAAAFDALFFCTGAPEPLFSFAERKEGQRIFDLGSPPQVERSAGVSPFLLAIDDLAGEAAETAAEYRTKLRRLESEAAEAARSVCAELASLSAETYKRLVLLRAERIVEERAELTARKTGADRESLRRMGWSVVKALLSPAFAESDPHARRLWKILSGDMEEPVDD